MRPDPLLSIPTTDSDSSSWILWFKTLKSYFGKSQARITWLKAWEKRGSDSANNAALRQFLAGEGIDLERDWKDAITEDTGDFLSNPFGLGDTLKFARTTAAIIIILVVIGLLAVVIQAIRNPGKTIELASLFTPQGRMAKAVA